MDNGLVNPVDEETPQCGPLSPLLSNIVLDEMDRELDKRGLRFVRYADDCNIYVGSRRAGERVMASVTAWLHTKLRLKVNPEKSAVARPRERVRELTHRTRCISIEQLVAELARYLRGWLGYFVRCETPYARNRLGEWTRHRLRSRVWKQWKTWRQRFTELRQRGIGRDLAAQTAGSAHGPWRLGNSPALGFAPPPTYFESLGPPKFLLVQ